MANTFFGFDSTINNDGNSLSGDDGDCLEPDNDCIETEEDEYDALNDETFGGLGDSTTLDDWEQQHEQYAEIAESKKHTDHIENSISQLVLDNSDDGLPTNKDYTDWSYPMPCRNGDIFNSTLLSSLQKTVSSGSPFIDSPNTMKLLNKSPLLPMPVNSHVPKKICTVEELERGLRQQKAIGPPLHMHHSMPQNVPLPPPPNHPYLQHQQGLGGHMPSRLPPGLHHPMRIPMPGPMGRPMPPGFNPSNLPQGYQRMAPPPHHHPGFGMLFPNSNLPFPVNHPFNFPPPPRNMNPPGMPPMSRHHQLQQQFQHQQQQQQLNNRNAMTGGNGGRMDRHRPSDGGPEYVRDEYAGLMTNREKQWLLNIQQLQLNTGTPYFDDYYYTVFKERKTKNNKENQPNMDRNQRFQRHNHHRNQERQENTLTPRVYTPLQFENSLGKLQCGSVTAPRKIIDMDVVTLEKDCESTPTRDTRKTKQLLLELEGLYSLLLRAEDLCNPLAISNTEKLLELKQKQRLRELEAAPTAEQKQEVLKLLQLESLPQLDSQLDYLNRIMTGLLQEDKFTSYLNIRKGKMLLLRVLPYLSADTYTGSFLELWMKVLLSLPAIGRRDTAGDNILPRLHPYFKRFVQTCKMADILEIMTNLVEVMRQENNRSTPLSHQGRAPLYFVVSNKFGVSALLTMLVRTEYLMSSDNTTEKQTAEWSSFVTCWADLCAGKCPLATPVELIPRLTFAKHANRIPKLTEDRVKLMERLYVDVN